MNIILAILIFSVIVIIHELGHFSLAKANGIFVKEFSLGMGPRIISFVRKSAGYRSKLFLSQHDYETMEECKSNTVYSIKLLPIGGSCIMLGEDEIAEGNKAFNNKPVWARISVIFAGPLFNFILAFILSMVIVSIIGYDPAKIQYITKDSPAEQAGLMVGDVITEFGGKHINLAREVDTYLEFHPLTGKDITVKYKRDGKKGEAVITPRNNYMLGFGYTPGKAAAEISDVYDNMPLAKAGIKSGDIITAINGVKIATGVKLSQYFFENPLTSEEVAITYERNGKSYTATAIPELVANSFNIGISVNSYREKTGVLGVLRYGAAEVKFWITSTIEGLGQLIRGKVGAEDLAGPVGIVDFIGDTYKATKSEGALTVFLSMANIGILLSANLGVMNLLPIPALDGGRLVFLLLEVLRGKPINQEKEGFVHMIGLVALLILMVFVLFNDLGRIF
ncbi:RIP metalloprotease RseP [Anaerocolumna aminovalerica]|jgi:regulator of sigma E protease|uniref:Zinc metalloprotease n=1 Tax=Anaerocolumna aminovalerica TaxID=1527 RepID=A0A1I5IEK9_9FIRM|nr:RIP metalloprotease RseP [Anaerocolumna aminovalerica]MBU5331549.1 RIP metalloprotease RseP [Anaerocolumna aminovalerica]MDU6265436.1 RIP metalloprotease RseP [Anaerocolumna aminovalerica]SFO58501.1 regulator of sigma E protease [Anaerocolumna aminovalerica]